MDWTGCPIVEVIPGKVSGVPLVVGTRMPADDVISNFLTGSPVREIAYNFYLSPRTVEELIRYAMQQHIQLAA